MATPTTLFKYLPTKYLESTVDSGKVFFRNFTYFRQIEGRTRGDYMEAIHRDNPDHNIRINNLSRNFSTDVDASFLNSTDSDLIYMFCTSRTHSQELYEEFESDTCIEILDPKEFARRLRIAIRQKASTHKRGLLHRNVTYYQPNVSTNENIKDATALPFLKDEIYAHQREFRFVFGTRRAFKLKQQIVINDKYDFRAEALKGTAREKTILIGSIDDITRVHHGCV